MQLLSELLSLLETRPGDDNTPAWYIVRLKDDAISSGPYDSRRQANSDTGRLRWWDVNKYDILYGVIDDESKNDFDTFKEMPEPKPEVKEALVVEGAYVVKNKDGVEKRFKDANAPAAVAWKNSGKKATTAKAAAYGKAYWERKEDDGADLLPWTKIQGDTNASDLITKIVDNQFKGHGVELDWTFNGKGNEIVRDGVPCASTSIRVSYEYGTDSDLGNDEPVSDSEYIVVARSPKNPKVIDFVKFGR